VGQFKLEFGSDSPAWRFYEALRAEGRSDPEIDHGYHRLDYRKPGPDGVLVNQRESHEEREVLEHVTDRYERYRRLIESYTGYPLSWVIDDPAIKARVAEAIGRIEAILRSQGLRPKTATYEEKLAVALFYFADFPEAPKDMRNWRSYRQTRRSGKRGANAPTNPRSSLPSCERQGFVPVMSRC